MEEHYRSIIGIIQGDARTGLLKDLSLSISAHMRTK